MAVKTGICPLISVGQQPGIPCRGEKCHFWDGSKYGCTERAEANAMISIADSLEKLVESLEPIIARMSQPIAILKHVEEEDES
jgi:hypothetical protein